MTIIDLLDLTKYAPSSGTSPNTNQKYTYCESSDGDHTVYIRNSNNIIPFDKFKIYKLRESSSHCSSNFKIIYPTHKDVDIIKVLDTFVKNQKSFSYIIDLMTYLFKNEPNSILSMKLFFKMLEFISSYDYEELTLRKIQFTNICLDWPTEYSSKIFYHFDRTMTYTA